MTIYTCWFEGYRKNEDSVEIEGDEYADAAEQFAKDDFWLNDSDNQKAWMGKSRTVFVQARGDDQAKMFNVSIEASIDIWADEI